MLAFIEGFVEERGYAPTLREIASELGIRGAKNAAKHLAALERKGFIRRRPGLSRAIEVVERPGRAGRGGVAVPIAGRVRAGMPSEAVEDVVGHVTLDPGFFNCPGAFLLRVEGESMTGAGIDEGDFVLVRPQPDAANGEIVVAMVDDEATVKRFSRKGGRVVLKAENPAFEPITIGGGEAEVSIVGKVVSVIKRLEG